MNQRFSNALVNLSKNPNHKGALRFTQSISKENILRKDE
jgi:hypothetical protein